MGLITRLRLEFDDSHVVLRARCVQNHPATRLCKILEAIESGNDVVALSLCEEYDVVSTTREATPTKNNDDDQLDDYENNNNNSHNNNNDGRCRNTSTCSNKNNHTKTSYEKLVIPNGGLANGVTFFGGVDIDTDESDEDDDELMLMQASTVGEAEAKVRFRQKLCNTSVAVFNYLVDGELHIPQEASFKEFQKVIIILLFISL